MSLVFGHILPFQANFQQDRHRIASCVGRHGLFSYSLNLFLSDPFLFALMQSDVHPKRLRNPLSPTSVGSKGRARGRLKCLPLPCDEKAR